MIKIIQELDARRNFIDKQHYESLDKKELIEKLKIHKKGIFFICGIFVIVLCLIAVLVIVGEVTTLNKYKDHIHEDYAINLADEICNIQDLGEEINVVRYSEHIVITCSEGDYIFNYQD